jgi:hypothetical protein
MASTRLHRTPGSSSNQVKWTWSGWIKKCTNSLSGCLFCAFTDANNYTELDMGSNQIDYYNVTGGGVDARRTTSAYQRDPGAWYHVVVVWDSANATPGDRMKVYINGVEQTAFSATTDPSSSLNSIMNSTAPQEIGARALGTTTFFNGYMAHVHFCDGQAYAASDFGETDSTSGIWIAKTSPSVSYGTNGYFLKFASGALGTDSSGNGNNMTVVGDLNHNKDNPDNNFATLNPNYPSNGYSSQSPTFANGNNTLTTVNASGQWGISPSTVALSTGKWYAECKISATSGDTLVGILSYNWAADQYLGYYSGDYGYYSSNGQIQNDGGSAYGDTYTTADIIGIYLDLDNNKLYFAKNGTIQNSGTGFTITAAADTNKESYMLAAQEWNSSGNGTFQWNFGNGYFGTDLIASASADAGGEGQFKYNPSTGTFDGSSKDFRAICTNNIATYG